MNEIVRNFNSHLGLQRVENLSGTVFTAEGFAHTFIIHHYGIMIDTGTVEEIGFPNSSDVTARFIRSDGVTVWITGQVNYGVLYLTLPPECYAVPGRFVLSIFDTVETVTTCVYAAFATVTATETEQAIIPEESAKTIEARVIQILGDAWSAALFARNIGEIEGNIDQFQTTVDGIVDALAAADVRALNTPNLLNKDAWWVDTGSGKVVCGDAARWSKAGGAYMKSIKAYDVYTTEPTQEQTAGATYVYHREADAQAGITEAWFVYRDADDGITTSYVDLTGSAIITDVDGETYDNAIQYDIVANTAWGNMETLYYPKGQYTQTYKQGEIPKSHGNYVDEMQVGKKYTVSCWARLTSGTEAWLKFGWGGSYMNAMGVPSNCSGVSGIYKVKNTEWVRLYWTFVFNPAGAEYSETTEQATDSGGNTYTKVIRTYNWHKRVLIGVHRKYNATLQLTGFRLTSGGLFGDNTVDTLQESVDLALESIAPVENEPTASTAYASGALLVWAGRLYKTTAAIASGAAFVVGTNLTATTLAQELAAMAAQVAGV